MIRTILFLLLLRMTAAVAPKEHRHHMAVALLAIASRIKLPNGRTGADLVDPKEEKMHIAHKIVTITGQRGDKYRYEVFGELAFASRWATMEHLRERYRDYKFVEEVETHA